MHASSLENMNKCYEAYICGDYLSSHNEISVLDIGGADINGSYADIFSQPKFKYTAADLTAGAGVTHVLQDPYKLPFDNTSIDIIISGQAFEHVEFFWKLFKEMARVVKKDGWIFLIAPSSGPIHRFPVDCYRFYPDSFHALAKYADIKSIEVFRDNKGPWNDLVGVFSKTEMTLKDNTPEWKPLARHEINRFIKQALPVCTDIEKKPGEVEKTSGNIHYLDILQSFHTTIKPRNYLEIGVRKGKSLCLAKCPSIAIDPDPDIEITNYNKLQLFKMPSDYFFLHQKHINFNDSPLDLVFIDGMHLFEFALRDFINIEERSHPDTVVVIDDILPNHAQQAERNRLTQVWTGDIWKLMICLSNYRNDLTLTTIDSYPTGLLVIQNLNSNNRTLLENYNPIVRKYREIKLDSHADTVLKRKGSIHPDSPDYHALLSDL